MTKKKKTVFINGPISPDFIANSIQKHQTKTSIGAHDIFLGQVRADEIDNKTVTAIEYTAYEEMAEKTFHGLRMPQPCGIKSALASTVACSLTFKSADLWTIHPKSFVSRHEHLIRCSRPHPLPGLRGLCPVPR